MIKIGNFIGALVLSVGGVGVIIIALTTFISKLWVDLFMKKKTAEYDRQIEQYKSDLETTREKYKALNEQVIYRNQKIFDVEFKMYQDITPLVMKLSISIQDYLMLKNILIETEEKEKIKAAINNFDIEITKYSIFIENDISRILIRYTNDCRNYVRNVNELRTNIYKEISKSDNDLYVKALIEDAKYMNLVLEYVYTINCKAREVSEAIRNYIKENTEVN